MSANNKNLRKLTLAMAFMAATGGSAQKRIGDFIESRTYNGDKRGIERTLNYRPEGRDFVCVNGSNEYTRALYGGYTEYRIETSDRPIFAVFKKRGHRNVRFRAIYRGNEYALEATDWCEARYSDASRRYVVKHNAWGDAAIYINVVALADTEGAVWQFRAEGFDEPLKLKAMVCNIANTKIRRNGDMGADPPGCFGPAAGDAGLAATEWDGSGESYFTMEGSEIGTVGQDVAAKLFNATVERNKALASRIEFNTPDPFINTLGGALVIAADGDWDGKTWLHGCVGWRMPLAGTTGLCRTSTLTP